MPRKPVRLFPLIFCLVFFSACTGAPRTGANTTPSLPSYPPQEAAAASQAITHTLTVTATATLDNSPTQKPTETEPTQTPETTNTATITPTPTITWTPGPTATLAKDGWKSLPVLPETISDTARAIYQLGQLMGNNPNAFSKVGDCHSTLPYFLGDFDDPEVYDLGEYADLQTTIDYFSGSFSRRSFTVKVGLSSGAALAVLWNDWKECSRTETPVDCEYRIHKPSFAFISVGTNDVTDRASMVYFEDKMRRLLDHTIGKGIVPILVTKPDNAEGDHSINATIVDLAREYDLPLWNFWAAIQDLPCHGLMYDHPEHLSMPDDWSLLCRFDVPENMKLGFPLRNLSALQMLDMLRRAVTEDAP